MDYSTSIFIFSFCILIITVVSYLLGSIPFGLAITRLAGYGDIRTQGSGNIGATNVLRQTNRFYGVATLILDGMKGAVAIVLVRWLWDGNEDRELFEIIAASAAISGHIFPIWLKFRGGKGVATTLAALLILFWPAGLLACAMWVSMFILFNISSLSSLASMLTAVISAYWLGSMQLTIGCAIIASVVIIRHYENIMRLLKGEESTLEL